MIFVRVHLVETCDPDDPGVVRCWSHFWSCGLGLVVWDLLVAAIQGLGTFEENHY